MPSHSDKTVEQLRRVAKRCGLTGYSGLRKSQLRQKLSRANCASPKRSRSRRSRSRSPSRSPSRRARSRK